MKEPITDSKKTVKDKPIPNMTPNSAFSGTTRSAKNLGNGRWSYQGKNYKEQSI